jgi:hypothetical protein
VWGEVKFIGSVWWGDTKRAFVKLASRWQTVLNWIFKTGWEGVDRIRLGEDRYKWRALANRVIYLKYLRNCY